MAHKRRLTRLDKAKLEFYLRDGANNEEIERAFSLSKQTVCTYRNRFDVTGLVHLPRPGKNAVKMKPWIVEAGILFRLYLPGTWLTSKRLFIGNS